MAFLGLLLITTGNTGIKDARGVYLFIDPNCRHGSFIRVDENHWLF
jgi:hypothetical protein